MSIEELSKELYEDLNGRITAVDYTEDLVIYFQCDDWKDHDKTRKYKITCNGVSENQVEPSSCSEIEYTTEHQLLWNHNEPHGYLYYSSEAESRHEILGRVWEAHEQIYKGWRPLADNINTWHTDQLIEFCKGRNGLLASGPKPLLDVYEQAIEGKIKTNYVRSYQPDGEFKALVFDTCFVICKSVAVVEIRN